MNKLTLLSTTEMKRIKGGIIDKETTYELCMSWYNSGYTGEPDSDLVLMGFSQNQCENFIAGITSV